MTTDNTAAHPIPTGAQELPRAAIASQPATDAGTGGRDAPKLD